MTRLDQSSYYQPVPLLPAAWSIPVCISYIGFRVYFFLLIFFYFCFSEQCLAALARARAAPAVAAAPTRTRSRWCTTVTSAPGASSTSPTSRSTCEPTPARSRSGASTAQSPSGRRLTYSSTCPSIREYRGIRRHGARRRRECVGARARSFGCMGFVLCALLVEGDPVCRCGHHKIPSSKYSHLFPRCMNAKWQQNLYGRLLFSLASQENPV